MSFNQSLKKLFAIGHEPSLNDNINNKHVYIANQTPLKFASIKQIPIEEFELEHNFKYINTIKFAKDLDIYNYQNTCKKILQEHSIPQYSLNQLQQQDTETFKNIVIAKMDNFGVGAFANATIRKNSLLVYWGEITTQASQNNNTYSFSLSYCNSTIDATQFSGIARFVQHAPNENSLCKTNPKPMQIATKNFITKTVYITDLQSLVIIFEAIRDIQPQEMLTINYDWGYWLRNVPIQIFTNLGEPIKQKHYIYNELVFWVPNIEQIVVPRYYLDFKKNIIVHHKPTQEILHIAPHNAHTLKHGGLIPSKILAKKDTSIVVTTLQKKITSALQEININFDNISYALEPKDLYIQLIFKDTVFNKSAVLNAINNKVMRTKPLALNAIWLINNLTTYSLQDLTKSFTSFGNVLLLDNDNNFVVLLEMPYGQKQHVGSTKLSRYKIPLHNQHTDEWVKILPITPNTIKIMQDSLNTLDLTLGIQFLLSDLNMLQW